MNTCSTLRRSQGRLAWGQFETICEITPWILPWWGGGGRPNYILITHPTSLQFASVKISYRSQTIFQSHNPRGNFVMIKNIVLPITQITIVAYFSNTIIIVSILLTKIPSPLIFMQSKPEVRRILWNKENLICWQTIYLSFKRRFQAVHLGFIWKSKKILSQQFSSPSWQAYYLP